jgi:D-3-phosphoglycerate dehydrogenase
VGVEPVTSLMELCERGDFVSMHAPLNAETHHLMSTAQFRAMTRTALFINNGRGPTVDEAALIEALRHGQIAGAALDVFEVEPVDPANPLLAMDNVIVTPHIASATARMAPETRRRLGREIATVLQGKWPRSAVNPGVLPRTTLIRWQPYPMGRGPNR